MTSIDAEAETNPSPASETDKQVANSAKLFAATILTHHRGLPQYEPRLSDLFGDVPFTTDDVLQKVAQSRADACEASLKSAMAAARGASSAIFKIARWFLSAHLPRTRPRVRN